MLFRSRSMLGNIKAYYETFSPMLSQERRNDPYLIKYGGEDHKTEDMRWVFGDLVAYKNSLEKDVESAV